MHRKVAGLVAAALALGAASCGGDEPLTKAEFIRQADAVCVESRRVGTAEQSKLSGNGASMREVVDKALEVKQTLAADLAEIEPPESLAASYKAYLRTLKLNTSLSREIVASIGDAGEESVKAGSPTAKLATRRDAVTHETVRLAKAMGLTDCGV